ncbi:MAG: hypothetical protein MAG451_01044 [Anaerolineales bacterium]|nr:hypothetical protein [Anaerolineales bacterium]
MQHSTLRTLLFFGMMMIVFIFLAPADAPSLAQQSPLGVTPTIGVGEVTPVPVGGNLALADRGAVLQATFGSLIVPLVVLVTLAGAVGFVVMRRWSNT